MPYGQDKVWRALTDPKLLGSWFMENNIEPIQGHHFTFRMNPQKGWDGTRSLLLNRKNIFPIPIVARQQARKRWLVQVFILIQQTS